jgi:urea transport system permease protein
VFLIGQQATTGGSNGLNGFRSFFGFDLKDPSNKLMLYMIAAVVLLLSLAVARQLMQSRLGELLVAVRDQEERVRFLGYDPATVKTVIYVIAAVLAGVAGALFVPLVGIVSPADVGVIPSIAFLIGVAIGGRATLLGPVLGAVGVSAAQSSLSSTFPSFWVYFQGLLFVLVIGFMPGGLASLPAAVGRWRAPARASTPEAAPRPSTGPEAPGPAAPDPEAPDPAVPDPAVAAKATRPEEVSR